MIYTVAEYLTAFFEAVTFYLLLDTFCMKKETYPKYIYWVSIFVLSIMIIICNKNFSYRISNGIGMALSTFLISFLFDNNIPVKAIISVVGYLLASLMEVCILFIIMWVYRVDAIVAINDPYLRLLGIILSKMLAFMVVSIVCMISKRKKLHLSKSYWFIFVLQFMTSTLAVFLIYKLAYESAVMYMNYLLLICSFGLLLSSFFLFYICEKMAKQNEIINRQQQYEQQLQAQAKHLDDILVNQEALRKFRHDIANHFTTITGYFKDDNCEDGLNYISEISSIVTLDKDRIKTGNTAFDAIINTKKALAESKGISFDINVQIPERLPIDAVDICVIFGNALDNAIEACEKITDGEKRISLTFIYENNAALCKIINTSSTSYLSAKTHKKDKINHGLGINNIKSSLSKYHNMFKIEQVQNEFVLEFVIFCD